MQVSMKLKSSYWSVFTMTVLHHVISNFFVVVCLILLLFLIIVTAPSAWSFLVFLKRNWLSSGDFWIHCWKSGLSVKTGQLLTQTGLLLSASTVALIISTILWCVIMYSILR